MPSILVLIGCSLCTPLITSSRDKVGRWCSCISSTRLDVVRYTYALFDFYTVSVEYVVFFVCKDSHVVVVSLLVIVKIFFDGTPCSSLAGHAPNNVILRRKFP